ncbi:DNA replication protein DnaD [Secundilactobacillus pentosiphilus]|uniref:DNA replication protein DnaD n=1 Tax=Secundilactobacillus pentosiphilus TaxID=1714682 RepID=A0A1Z5IZ41_9LACO|nr:Lin1244/Lin1753 domain-containing protein [Secundilactobacillus pentosiphilus]GAX06832.1 DNA replication protein DnaD [Secundilactobacillus pentosiphilus]
MARPVKDGLDYFPLDVDFAVNPKTEAIMGEFGSKGVLLMIYLLSAVYRKGYYLVWDKLEQMQLVNRVQGSSAEMANQIVDRLIAYGTFDEELFNSAKVLTSLRIQETYFDAIKRRKTPKPTKYLVNVDINSGSSEVNDDINTQSKVKESKEKNIEEDARANVFDLWQKLWGFPNAIAQQDLDEWITAMSPELIHYAIEIAGKNNVSARAADKYIGVVVDGWQKRQVKTLEQAKQANAEHEQRLSTAKGGYSGNGRKNVKETLPDWAKPDYQAPKKELSDDEQAKTKAETEAALNKLKALRQKS